MKRVQELKARGDTPDNFDEFMAICDEVQDIVERQRWLHAAKRTRERLAVRDDE